MPCHVPSFQVSLVFVHLKYFSFETPTSPSSTQLLSGIILGPCDNIQISASLDEILSHVSLCVSKWWGLKIVLVRGLVKLEITSVIHRYLREGSCNSLSDRVYSHSFCSSEPLVQPLYGWLNTK